MRTLLLTIVLTISALNRIYAGAVDQATAQNVAVNFYKTAAPNGASNVAATLKYTQTESDGSVDFYVFDITSPNNGFVIVSANNATAPVIGYSTESNFSTDFSRFGLADWITTTSTKIHTVTTKNIQASTHVTDLWTSYISGTPGPTSRSSTVAPLVTTTWNQYPYYNLFCPYNSTDKTNAVTGCVATAMAQIMRYWSYPAKGMGSYSYNDATPSFSNNYGTQSANFGATTYNWAKMGTSATGPTNDTAIATLMYHCGVAVAMDYGDINQGGSGAMVIASQSGGQPNAQTAYATYFGYDASKMKGVVQSSYTTAAWSTLLQGELNAARPLQYEGFGPEGGHTWVCDGYDANGLFHMNWGWGGYSNGYFDVTNLQVAGDDFTSNDAALIGIQPTSATSCGVPTASSSNVATTTATITWGNVPNVTSYNVQYKLSTSSTWTTVSTTSTSYNLTGLTSGGTYNYQVQTVCSSGSSAYSTAGSFTTLSSSCGTPTGLTSSAITTTTASVSWNAVTGATGYVLQFKTDAASSWYSFNLTNKSANISGLVAGTLYDFQVQSVCASGSSVYSSVANFTTSSTGTTCGVPASLSASNITTSTASLSWGAVSGATSYTLQYKLSTASNWNSLTAASNSGTISGLAAGSTYNFQVAATCSGGTSAYSTASSFTTTAAVTCGVPASLASSAITTTTATVSWGAVTSATSYTLQYKLSTASTWTSVTVTGTSSNLTGLTAGSTYNYQVSSTCSSGTSAYSAASSFTTTAAQSCGVPASLASSSITTTGATLSWGAVSGATSYTLQYKLSTATTWSSVTVTGTSSSVSGLAAGSTYNYEVSSKCSSGTSAYSAVSSFTTTAVQSCGVPSGLGSSNITTSTATLSWAAVGGATSYTLQYKLSTASTWTSSTVTGTSTSLSNLTASSTYNYQVSSTCASGTSAYSSASSFTTAASCGVVLSLSTTLVTSASATVAWVAISGATSYNIQYKASSASSWSTLTASSPLLTISGLSPSTTYNFQVQAVCSNGAASYSAAANFTTAAATTSSYCTVKGNSTSFEYLKNVKVGSFSNTSASNGGYGDFTSLTIPMATGSTQSITLTPGWTVGSYKEGFAVYIDYNNNGDFTDAGEKVFTSAPSTSVATGTFTVPANLSGTARMRVIMEYNAVAGTPCGTFQYGEAEDYTVNFSSTGSLHALGDAGDFGIDNTVTQPWLYPNPANSNVHVMLVPVDNVQTKVEIFSITGQLVSTFAPNMGDREAIMDLTALAPGMYLVRTTIGDERETVARLVKQ